ncbi:TPA: hypothetical protein ACH3X3_007604 [Trebouxia sp. C0006]
MFSLMYGLWEYVCRKEELNVLIIGLDNAGKTTVLEKIKGMYSSLPGMAPEEILPTVGLNVGRIHFSSGTKLILWDLGGQSGLQNIWDKYYADCHAILFVIDATDLSRVEEAKEALDKPLGGRDTFGAPLLVLANKSDQQDVAQSADEVASNLGLSAVTSRPHKVLQASGHSGQGIADGMSWLVSAVQHSNRALLMRQRRSRQ